MNWKQKNIVSADHSVIFFDGICNLCNNSVKFIIRHDKKRVFKFAAFQSKISEELLRDFDIDESIDSVILLKKNKIYVKSDAAFEIIKDFSFFWKLLMIFKILPKFIRDSVYDYIAKNRYKWFGKRDECMIPTKELQSLFLE